MANGSLSAVSVPTGFWLPQTEEERQAVRAQLDLLLSTPQFSVSRRYPTMLRYVVEQTLQGRLDGLKERTLGVDVFGRDPAYDTNLDPVVRMTAAQIRRRLVDYYGEPGHGEEIRIELPVGSYVPVFRKPQPPEPALPSPPMPADLPIVQNQPARHSWPLLLIAAAVLSGLAAAAYYSLVAPRRQTALEKFWEPVWGSAGSVLICVGEWAGTTPSSTPLGQVAWSDALTMARVAGFATVNRRTPVIRRAADTTFAQLRATPAVLIGGFNNQWIMRLTSGLRFTYKVDRSGGNNIHWIEDRQNPADRRWAVYGSVPPSARQEDFGIIMRYFDRTTERVTVVASGIAYYGTIASGEFLTDARSMEAAVAGAPKDWERKNMQVVFSTAIINGETGPPQILATHFW